MHLRDSRVYFIQKRDSNGILFADDPFVNLMNIFTFHFTANLFSSLWVLSALS